VRREHDALPSARLIVKLSTARIGGALTGVAAASSVMEPRLVGISNLRF